MGLIKNPDIIRLSPDDPIPNYLSTKIIPGQGVVFTRKVADRIGYQAIIGLDQPGAGGSATSGIVFTAEGTVQVPNNATLILINSANEPAVVTLPHPGEVIGWLSVVCIDNTNGITLKSPFEDSEPQAIASVQDGVPDEFVDLRTKIFDRSNIDFHAAGDSLIFASNRFDTWFCIGKYSALWYA